MHILYNPDTLVVECVIYSCHETAAEHHRAMPNHVEHPETFPHDEIELRRDEAGAISVHRRAAMTIKGPSSVAVGAEAVFEGIPEGVAVTIEGEAVGVMDSGGRLEFTPEVSGLYRICFAGSGWLPREISLEAFEG